MPEPMATPKEQAMVSGKERLQQTAGIQVIREGGTIRWFIPDSEPVTEESIWHPVKAVKDLIEAVKENTRETSLVRKQMEMERNFKDFPVSLGATMGYRVDYEHRKYLYAWTTVAASLVYNGVSANSVALTINKWVNISPPRGTIVTLASGSDTAPQIITLRLCDVIMN